MKGYIFCFRAAKVSCRNREIKAEAAADVATPKRWAIGDARAELEKNVEKRHGGLSHSRRCDPVRFGAFWRAGRGVGAIRSQQAQEIAVSVRIRMLPARVIRAKTAVRPEQGRGDHSLSQSDEVISSQFP